MRTRELRGSDDRGSLAVDSVATSWREGRRRAGEGAGCWGVGVGVGVGGGCRGFGVSCVKVWERLKFKRVTCYV